ELGYEKIVLAGGVSANKLLRETMKSKAEENNIICYFPELKYCTDNAAMIGSAAYFQILNGGSFADGTLAPSPNLPL
ncbi:MAG: tRNA (adenosine(37)-N6)-threonylcarbamoyltransferase complex transferase subunit TsaD, partial [Clostridia bacterium]|nr:tRNA (adenosine(37)-N6)-threonylcarbamoyltransferase complex transferase subunit TsaD [Clostridia bacterium]